MADNSDFFLFSMSNVLGREDGPISLLENNADITSENKQNV